MENLQAQVDQIFSEYDHTVTPGCALAVVKEKEVIYKRGYGMANLEYGIPIRPDTVFHIASVSKQFAALAVTLLAHDGKLSLDDEVQKYVSEVPDFGEKITIRHLIHHTSGLRDQWELLIAAGWRMDDVITMDDILELVSKQKELNFKPGDDHIYCNTGYTLLSFIVQRVTEKSMREFCEERIFKPLGMKNTHFHDDHTMVVKNRAYSYSPSGYNQYANNVLNYANVGATSLFTTVEDLALWDREFYEGKVFGKAVIDEVHTLGVLNDGKELEYAYGLRIAKYRGLKIVEHSGGDAGYRTHLVRFPEQNFSVIVFSNLGTVSPGSLAYKVADLYLAEQFTEEVEQAEAIELPTESLHKLIGLYYSEKEQESYRLEMRDGKLIVDIEQGFELEAIAEDEFRLVAIPFVKMKIKETEGVYQMVVGMGGYGNEETFDRVEQAEISKETLEAYAGIYTSPELEVNYRLLVEEDKLVLQRRKYGKQPLEPTIEDCFDAPRMHIRFSREDNGVVTACMFSSGRVKNLKFIKQYYPGVGSPVSREVK